MNTCKKKWSAVISYHLEHIGGIDHVRSNFDSTLIPKQTPSFYKTCFSVWDQLTKCNPATLEEVALQQLWNNKKKCGIN